MPTAPECRSSLSRRTSGCAGYSAISSPRPNSEERAFSRAARRCPRSSGPSTVSLRPIGTHTITPFVAELALDTFDDFHAEVVALEVERTFWEKATILHAEYHRPAGQPIRDRFARHYADFAALWENPSGRAAASTLDLLERVRTHKSRFFSSSWAHYETAVPGTLRLAPPNGRLTELRRDYTAMAPMFFTPPPEFDTVLKTLREAEDRINAERP